MSAANKFYRGNSFNFKQGPGNRKPTLKKIIERDFHGIACRQQQTILEKQTHE